MMYSLYSIIAFLAYILLQVSATKDDPDYGLQIFSPNGKPNKEGTSLTLYSAKLTFPNVNDVYTEVLGSSELKLSHLARNAWWQMNKKWVETNPQLDIKSRPAVMAAIAVGKEIYFSSSLKGGSFVYHAKDPENPVYQALTKCQAEFLLKREKKEGDKDGQWDLHRNKASCGEVMAAYAYFQDHPDEATNYKSSGKSALQGAHIVAVRNLQFNTQASKGRNPKPLEPSKTPLPYDQIVVFNPCGTDMKDNDEPRSWGCFEFTRQFGLIPVIEGADGAAEFEEIDLSTKEDDKAFFRSTQIPISC